MTHHPLNPYQGNYPQWAPPGGEQPTQDVSPDMSRVTQLQEAAQQNAAEMEAQALYEAQLEKTLSIGLSTVMYPYLTKTESDLFSATHHLDAQRQQHYSSAAKTALWVFGIGGLFCLFGQYKGKKK